MVGNFAYLTDVKNLSRKPGLVLTASSEKTGYPKANAVALPISKPWRSLTIASGGESMLFDFGEIVSVSLIDILNHNLSDAGTIKVEYGPTSAVANLLAGGIAWRAVDAFRLLGASARFWKITLDDSGNLDGFIQVGYFVFGVPIFAPTNFSNGWEEVVEYLSAETFSDSRVPHIAEFVRQRRFVLPYADYPKVDADALATLFEDTKRNVHPLVLIPDKDGADAYFGRMQNNFSRVAAKAIDFRDTSIEFLEESRGRSSLEPQGLIYNAGESLSTLLAVFTRASTASQVDSVLGIQFPIGIDAVRDAHYITLGTKLLLLEAARTNTFERSEEFDNVYWSKVNVTVSANAITAPDGLTSADKIVETAVTDIHVIQKAIGTFGMTDNTLQSVSLFVKDAERDWVAIGTFDKGGTQRTTWFNASTGAFGTINAGHTVRSVALANGWYRIEIIWNSGAGASAPEYQFRLADADGSLSYLGDSTKGAYFWGAQFEVNIGFPTSYIPTTTAAVLRANDILYIPFTETPKSITAYVRFIELGTIKIDGRGLIYIGNAGDTGARFWIDGASLFYKVHHHNGSVEVSAVLAASPTIGDLVEIRAVMDQNGAVQIHQSINAGAETSSSLSSGNTIAAAWSDTRLYINSRGSANFGAAGFRSVKLLRGVQTMQTCRDAKAGEAIVRFP